MKITILDDYQNAVQDLNCFKLLKEQNVQILNYTEKNSALLAEKLFDTSIIILIRERTNIDENLLKLLPNLKLISQTGKISNPSNIWPNFCCLVRNNEPRLRIGEWITIGTLAATLIPAASNWVTLLALLVIS